MRVRRRVGETGAFLETPERGATLRDRGRKRPLVIGAYVCFLLALAGWTFAHAVRNWDMIGYMAVLTSWQTTNPVEMHRRVYQEIRRNTSPAAYEELTSGPFRADIAANPWHLAEQLPFYNIKPLYLDVVWLGRWFGLRFDQSLRILSVLAGFGLGILCFQWMRIYLSDPQSAVISACLFLTAPLYRLETFSEPDALNALVLVASMYLLFEKRKTFPGLLLLCAAPLVRPDSAILCLVVLAYLAVWAPPRLAIKKLDAFVLAGTVAACVFTIGRWSGNYGWKVLFVNSIKSPVPTPGDITPLVTRWDYWAAARATLAQLLSGSGLILFVFFIALCLLAGAASLEPGFRDLLILLAVAIACQIVVYPNLEARYYAFALVPTAVGYVACMARRKILDSKMHT
jgi:hypothetical protein